MTAPAVDEPWFIRPATEADHNFVWETTLMVRRPHGVPVKEWRSLHGNETTRVLAEGKTAIIDAEGVILGFVVVSARGLEMLFVKKDWRGLGLGLLLLEEAGACYPGSKDIAAPVVAPTPSFRHWTRHHHLTWRMAA